MNSSPQLHDLLKRPQPTLLCGVHDGLSACLAERAGFDALWASGFCISAGKRMPDVGLVTLSEHLAATREIIRSTRLPVVADVDDGFGDAINVIRTVREYEAAGAAAVCIEDNAHPKRSSLYSDVRRKLVGAEEFAAKIRAATKARSGPGLAVIARTEAIVADLGVDEALRRARLYSAAGAELIVVHSKDADGERVKEFASRWDLETPLAAIPTTYPDTSVSELGKAGYRMVIFANQGLRASISAMQRVFKTLAQTRRLASVENQICPVREVGELVGLEEVKRAEAEFAAASAAPGTEKTD